MTEFDAMDEDTERGLRLLLVGALVLIAVGGTIDLALDAPARWLSVHVMFELSMIAIAFGITVALGRGWLLAERSLVQTQRVLEERRSERDAWRASAEAALEGLGHAVDAQFAIVGVDSRGA